MVRDGATSQSQLFRVLSAQNEQLRADVVQLRFRAVGTERRPPKTNTQRAWHPGSCGGFSSVGVFRQHVAPVSGVCVAGCTAVASAWDGRLTSFDLSSWQEGPRTSISAADALRQRRGEVAAAAVPVAPVDGSAGSPLQCAAAGLCAQSRSLVLCGSEDSYAWLWNMDTGRVEALVGHEDAINAVCFHPKQPNVACTASDDCRALIWDTSCCTQVRSLSQHSRAVTGAKLLGALGGAGAAHDRSLVTASADGHLRVWDLRAPFLLFALPAAASRRLVPDASAPSQLLLAASDLGTVTVWDLRTLATLQHLDVAARTGLRGELTSMALSPCCSHLALGASDGTLLCLDLRSPADVFPSEEECAERRPAHDDAIFGLAWGSAWPWRPDPAPFLVCSSLDGTWSCWARTNEEGARSHDSNGMHPNGPS